MVAGAALVTVSLVLTFGHVGRSATTTVSSTSTAAHSAETPAAFLDELAGAMRSGNVDFMVARLNPAVIAHYGRASCRQAVVSYIDPTAAFTLQSASPPADYTYTVSGTSVVVPDTITAQATFTRQGHPGPVTAHLSRTSKGELTWFTDCSASPGG
jgi:hypothetical protein